MEEALLSWLPQMVTELPGEDPADGPGTLRTLIAYLHDAGLNDPLGPPPEVSLAAVPEDGAAEALREQGPQMADAVAAALASDHPDKAGLEELRRLTAGLVT